MNNLSDLRDQKFLNALKNAGDCGYFDWELEKTLGWKLVAVRSIAASLRNRGKCSIFETTRGWYICFLEDLIDDVNKDGSKQRKKTGK